MPRRSLTLNDGAATAAFAAVFFLTGCGGPYHERDGVVYDGYYDGFYGPYPGGYWGSDTYFYYSDGRGGYHRDDGRHFHHERFDHGEPFHADRDHHDAH